jgi:flagellar biosynthetic protein FlhB
MAEQPASERTEQPTPRKLEKAREQGQVPHSEELPATVGIIVILAVLALSAPTLLGWFCTQIQQGLSCQSGIFKDSGTFINFFNKIITSSILVILPLLTALIVGSVLSCIIVSGLNFNPQALNWKFDEISPAKGIERLFNIRSTVKLGISIAKLIIVSVIAWFYIQGKIDRLVSIQWAWSAEILVTIAQLIAGLLIRICTALLVIAAVDVIFQKLKYLNDMKMTKQEVKHERKDTDGSPEVKSRIRRIQFEMTKKRMMKTIPTADVILVNPTHYAVALKYDPKAMDAPIVVAKGADFVAAKIREIATAYGVPIIRKPELARAIYSTVKVGKPVPGALYTAVAEVLAMIYRLRHNRT